MLVEMNPAAGTQHLDAVRAFLVCERGFSLVAKLGQMNELYEHIPSRPSLDEDESAGNERCDMGEHPAAEAPAAG